MAMMKLAFAAVGCQAALMCLATEEACDVSVSKSGRAMLQVTDAHMTLSSDSLAEKSSDSPSKKASPKDAPKQKVSSKSKAKAKEPDASNVPLSNSGYKKVADLCCNYEMEEYVRRIVMNENLKVCDEGGLQGLVPYYVCEEQQNYTTLLDEIKAGTSGACAWVAPKDGSCKAKSKACGAPADPMSHRRRNCGRNDNSQGLDLEMQNAATNEFEESKCGTHQVYTDVISEAGVMKKCSIKADMTTNKTALQNCLNECCITKNCIGVAATKAGAWLSKSFEKSEVFEGAMTFLHRQR